jgi:hypothetical protein
VHRERVNQAPRVERNVTGSEHVCCLDGLDAAEQDQRSRCASVRRARVRVRIVGRFRWPGSSLQETLDFLRCCKSFIHPQRHTRGSFGSCLVFIRKLDGSGMDCTSLRKGLQSTVLNRKDAFFVVAETWTLQEPLVGAADISLGGCFSPTLL